MKTNRKKHSVNKTRKNSIKNIIPKLKIMHKGDHLYASKKYSGDELLAYTRNNELKTHEYCNLDNINWFGNYDVAKSYKTKETKIYKFKINHTTKLLRIDKQNERFFKSLFLNTNIILDTSIQLKNDKLNNIDYEHPYLKMNNKEKAYYEFCFAFGYLTLQEQCDFMLLLKYLIEKNIIHMEMRDGKSIINKLLLKITYYRAAHIFSKKAKYNRLSFYDLDKHALLNICKLLRSKKINIHGIFQRNTSSFWFPDLIVYKMNIEETILFNPHHNLLFDKEVE